jgi:hypothetical protein
MSANDPKRTFHVFGSTKIGPPRPRPRIDRWSSPRSSPGSRLDLLPWRTAKVTGHAPGQVLTMIAITVSGRLHSWQRAMLLSSVIVDSVPSLQELCSRRERIGEPRLLTWQRQAL